MTYTFDYIVAKLKCPVCGNVSSADESTNMQTKICKISEMKLFGVHDQLNIDVGNIEQSGYLLVSEPNEDNTFYFIDSWECPNCEVPYNWALIELVQGTIVSIKEVELSVHQIESVNYISEDCGYLGWAIVDGHVSLNED